jgi:hypothetical protein
MAFLSKVPRRPLPASSTLERRSAPEPSCYDAARSEYDVIDDGRSRQGQPTYAADLTGNNAADFWAGQLYMIAHVSGLTPAQREARMAETLRRIVWMWKP